MKAYEIGEQYYANIKDERLDKETPANSGGLAIGSTVTLPGGLMVILA